MTRLAMPGLEEAGKAIRDSDKALGVNIIASLFEFSWYLRGYVDFLQDLMTNRKLAEAQLDAMLEYQKALVGEVLDRVGPYATFINTGSDLGTQRAPMVNPEVYRAVIWPRYRQLWDFIHSRSEAKIFYHSCGSIVPMIPMLAEGGVDAIHPVQPAADGMGDRARLKREFGADITFWGGFDQQDTLPFGTPDAGARSHTGALRRVHARRRLRLRGGPQHPGRRAAGEHPRHLRCSRRVRGVLGTRPMTTMTATERLETVPNGRLPTDRS